MKINTFVKKVNESKSMNEFIKKFYIPVATKREIAKNVIGQSTIFDKGCVYVDKFVENIYFSMLMIHEYTGVEISDDYNILVEEYDKVCGSGILDEIVDICSEDYIRMRQILSYEEYKLLSKNSIEASVAKVAESISDSLTTLSDIISDKIDNFDVSNIIPEGMDVANLLDIVNKLK